MIFRFVGLWPLRMPPRTIVRLSSFRTVELHMVLGIFEGWERRHSLVDANTWRGVDRAFEMFNVQRSSRVPGPLRILQI